MNGTCPGNLQPFAKMGIGEKINCFTAKGEPEGLFQPIPILKERFGALFTWREIFYKFGNRISKIGILNGVHVTVDIYA